MKTLFSSLNWYFMMFNQMNIALNEQKVTSHLLNGSGTSERPQVSIADPWVLLLHRLKEVTSLPETSVGNIVAL